MELQFDVTKWGCLPSITFARVDGGEIHSPGYLADGFDVILFHRAFRVRFCNAQLTAFARAADKFGGEDIKIASASVDNREKVEARVEQRERGSPVVCGPDARASSTSTFVNHVRLSPSTPLCPQSRRTDRNGGLFERRNRPSDARGCAGSGPTSYLWQQTEEQRQVGGEADEWRSRL
jgi:hypothetical protein